MGGKSYAGGAGIGLTHVVGVGASAGGLEALERLFDGVEPDSGMAYVVVQHLSPDFKSLMDELLARHTRMPIFKATDGVRVEPNTIYLMPPKTEMIISGGRLLLKDKEPSNGLSLPIDRFFRSLAQEAGEAAVAVVLSGTGTDGSRGVREVSECGGLVIAQSVETAQFDGMPQSAIDTDCVDYVLPPDLIGDALRRHALGQPPRPAEGDDPADPMLRVFSLLRERYSLDFSSYKVTSVSRRIQRRLGLLEEESLEDYVGRLAHDPAELEALYRDLLIGVTQFFRDAEAFESLRQRVISPLFVERPVDDPVRVWVAGCATGEEAYSLAMLLDEESRRHDWRGDIKVFATDVHRPSIDSAGRGVYEKEQATGLSEERTERYFLRKKDALQAATPLRQMVVFASHNVLRDAPFTRLDLVTCRNMLIYFRPEAQRKAISLFHFGLRSGGRLMLGPSETPGELSEEFDVVDQRHRLYRKRRDVSLLADIRLSAPKPAARLEAPAAAKGVGKSSLAERQVIAAYEQLSSARLAPSYLVNTRGELVYSTPGASRFLKTTDGFARNKFLDLVHGDLRTPIASLMRHCEQDAAAATLKSVTLGGAGGGVTVEVSVAPIQLPDYDEPVLAVTIDAGDAARTAPDAEQVERDELANERIDHLETELGHTRENLQATIQELETSNEELQAVNEELVASNEELQSTNEELHSVNEELHTINSEHQRKIEELTDLTEDMENLLQSSDSVTLFLDEQLTIRRFAPGAEKVFGILATDIGRGIDTFANTLDYPALFDDLGAAIREDRTIETEAASRGGVHYLVRITPYQSEVGSRGAVLSLVDLSPLRQAREELQASEQLFRGMFENSAVGMARKSLDGSWLNVNSRFCELLGYTREELLARTFRDVTHKDDVAEDTRQIELMASGKSDSYALQKRYLRKDGEVIWVNLTVSLQRSDTGEPLHCISVVQDITQTKRLEEQLREAIGQRDRFLATLSHELRNPLAALLHAARLLDRRSVPEEEGRPLGVILRQSQQMEALLRDLLDVSRVTQDKLSLHRSPVDLVGLARVAAETMAPQMQSHAHEFELDLPEGGVWIDADPTRILQVLENLLSNAARYTPRGGRVTLRLSTQGGAARVEVADTGRGLTPELIDRVFDMFVQSEESERSLDGGMGLGLTLTKSIVEMHGGRVTARSDGEGQGSTFEVLLPETDGRPTPAADHPAVGERVRRVVLVEDEADAREMLAETLELDGFDVATAADGDQGLALIIQELPEVALVDVALPGLTGYEIATQVRKTDNAAGVRLVAMTGYGRDEDRRAALEAGFDDHLVKPVQPADLLRVLTKPKGDA